MKWRSWTIVLGGKTPFLRFFSRRGAERWLRKWEPEMWMARERARVLKEILKDSSVERVDRVQHEE